jgi:excisionase family DNA binding protein
MDGINGTERATLTVDQAHALLGGNESISRASFYAAIGRNEVPHLKLGKRILIPRNAFNRWLESAGREQRASTGVPQ